MKKTDHAVNLNKAKFNCCQAVIMAYADELGIHKETAFAMAEGHGAGMGSTQGPCGALSGAIMVAGAKNSDRNLENPSTKVATYKIAKELTAKFEERVGAVMCKDIKGGATGSVLMSCPDCIRTAVELVQEVMDMPEK